MLITLPITILGLTSDLSQDGKLIFWPGWKVAHTDFSSVPTFTSEEWKAKGAWTVFSVRLDQWIGPLFASGFFMIFGLTERKRARYRNILRTIKGIFGDSQRPELNASNIVFDSRAPISSGGTIETQTAST